MDTVVKNVSNYDKKIVENVVEIHLATFEGFFLTFMGKGFLRQMYSSYCDHEESGLLISCDNEGKIIGFLAYSYNMSSLYKFMLKRRFLPFVWYSAMAFFRNPQIFLRLLRALLKPSESKRDEKYVELSSIGVSPEFKSCGIGSKLIENLKSIVDFNVYSYILLDTDAENNEHANAFYVKNGFSLNRTYSTREGRKMNEYIFRGQE